MRERKGFFLSLILHKMSERKLILKEIVFISRGRISCRCQSRDFIVFGVNTTMAEKRKKEDGSATF